MLFFDHLGDRFEGPDNCFLVGSCAPSDHGNGSLGGSSRFYETVGDTSDVLYRHEKDEGIVGFGKVRPGDGTIVLRGRFVARDDGKRRRIVPMGQGYARARREQR